MALLVSSTSACGVLMAPHLSFPFDIISAVLNYFDVSVIIV